MGLARWRRRCRWKRTQQKLSKPPHRLNKTQQFLNDFTHTANSKRTRRTMAMSPFCTRHVLFCYLYVPIFYSPCSQASGYLRPQGVSTHAAKAGQAGCCLPTQRQSAGGFVADFQPRSRTALCSPKASWMGLGAMPRVQGGCEKNTIRL